MAAIRMDARSWTLLVSLAGIWSASFLFAEVALESFGFFTVVLGRVSIGALGLWAFVLARGISVSCSPRLLLGFLFLGLINNAVPFTLITWGQTEILAGEAALLNATTPIFTALVGHFVSTDDRLTVNRIIGVALGIVGVGIMVGVELTALQEKAGFGFFAVLGSSISYGFASHLARRLSSGLSGPAAATLMLTASTLWMLPLPFIAGETLLPETVKAGSVYSVVGLGLLCSSIAYLCYFVLVQRAGATNTMLVTLLIPCGTMLFGALLLGERFGFNDFAGLVLIIAALAVTDGRWTPRLSR